MNIKTTLKSSVAAAALFAVVAPAQAGTVSNGNDAMSVTLSGHFNKGLWYYDSGDNSGVFQGDNGGSESRARIVAKGKVNEAVSVSGVYEFAMSASDENSFDPADGNAGKNTNGSEGGTTDFFGLRHGYVSLAHKQFGSIVLGHASEAGDGITEFGGVGNLQYGSTMLFGASVSLVNSTTNATVTGSTTSNITGSDLGAYRVSADGTRTSLVRYNTPNFAGFQAAVSQSNEQNTAAEVKFGGKFADFTVNAGMLYNNVGAKTATGSNAQVDAQWGGGISVGHASGISADFNYAELELDSSGTRSPMSWGAGVNYAAALTSAGTTTFRAAYSISKDSILDGDELTGMMFGVDQGVSDGVNIYAGVQLDSVETTAATSYDDVTTVFAGTKIVF